jgi:SAM domain (Sterile alpha motif)
VDEDAVPVPKSAPQEEGSSISSWLQSRGLAHYAAVFEREEIDLTMLPLLDDRDLADIGILEAGTKGGDASLPAL